MEEEVLEVDLDVESAAHAPTPGIVITIAATNTVAMDCTTKDVLVWRLIDNSE